MCETTDKRKQYDFTLTLAPANGANPGAIYVKLGSLYCGKIVENKFLKSRDCDDATHDAFVIAAQDPENAAILYGKLNVRCSVCNRKLTNKVSRELGIGPICRGKYF